MTNKKIKFLSLLLTAVILMTAMTGIVANADVAEESAVSKYQTVKVGIDVSEHQGVIDWSKVKNEVDFAMIRLGCTYYGSLQFHLDDYFVQNVEGAIAEDIPIGIYYYGSATSVEMAINEANFVLEYLDDYPSTFSYPIVYDIEVGNDKNASVPPVATEVSKAFCDTIKAAGYYPMVYSYTSYFNPYITTADISNYDFWQAHYPANSNYEQTYSGFTPSQFKEASGNRPSIQGNYDSNISIWQCTSEASVAGISGNVDGNICYFDYDAFIKAEGYNGYDKTVGDRTATCVGSEVNVRSGASTAFDVIGQAVSGDEFEVKRIYNKAWLEIDYNGQTGYVHSDYFTVEDTVETVLPENPDEDETPDVDNPGEDENPDIDNPGEDETPDNDGKDEAPEVNGDGGETEEERPGLFQRIGQAFANLFKIIGDFFKALFGVSKD